MKNRWQAYLHPKRAEERQGRTARVESQEPRMLAVYVSCAPLALSRRPCDDCHVEEEPLLALAGAVVSLRIGPVPTPRSQRAGGRSLTAGLQHVKGTTANSCPHLLIGAMRTGGRRMTSSGNCRQAFLNHNPVERALVMWPRAPIGRADSEAQ